jgi:murein tripeptide amidase MpaA
MKLKVIFGIIYLFITYSLFAQVKSPSEFLPFNLGEQFTPHHLLIDYYEHVASNSDQVKIVEYGKTNELRPLILAYIGKVENIENLEEIRKDNMKRAGMLEGKPETNISLVWLSYSVHGNEAAGSESSLKVLYELVKEGSLAQKWFENTVVILDPAVNPDGYSRYSHWYNRVKNKEISPNRNTLEHDEPWPGGRTNHYLFDLNRDWAWQTQIESKQRMKVYNEWLPHVHADLHEMGYTSPYYFAPAVEPYHEFITDFQREFQETIGRNHDKHFAANNWAYYTKESFDLLYPSYGDTYPTYNGAIGMTYEQGGSGTAGQGILMPNGDTLRLIDRINHHTTTSLSTIEVTANNSEKVLTEFAKYFRNSANNPPGKNKTYIVKNLTGSKKGDFETLLRKNQIKFGSSPEGKTVQAYSYRSGENEEITIEESDFLISAFQPRGILTQVLLDPEPKLSDSITYDITAWSLLHAYGLEAYASGEEVKVHESEYRVEYADFYELNGDKYAYVICRQSINNVKNLLKLNSRGVRTRYFTEETKIADHVFNPGDILIRKSDNPNKNLVKELMRAGISSTDIIQLNTGFTDSGPDLGSNKNRLMEIPKVATISGSGVSSNSFGQVWHFFEQKLDYPIMVWEKDWVNKDRLDQINTLVLTDGSYSFEKSQMDEISEWISKGGKLILIGSSISSFKSEKWVNIKSRSLKDKSDTTNLKVYADRNRERQSSGNPGAVVKLNLDSTHPLSFGIGETYFTLKTRTSTYEYLKSGWNVGRVPDKLNHYGFIGSKIKGKYANSLVIGTESKGDGQIIYLVDNPLFRAFWYQGQFLFSNALQF